MSNSARYGVEVTQDGPVTIIRERMRPGELKKHMEKVMEQLGDARETFTLYPWQKMILDRIEHLAQGGLLVPDYRQRSRRRMVITVTHSSGKAKLAADMLIGALGKEPTHLIWDEFQHISDTSNAMSWMPPVDRERLSEIRRLQNQNPVHTSTAARR